MNDDVRVLMMNSLRGAPRVDAALWQPGRAMRRSVVALALVSLVACEKRGTTVPPTTASPETSAEVLGSLDRQTDPCNDFYRFACGGWIDATPLPADQPRYGRFHVLRDRNAEAMRAILERAASKPGDKAGAFWTACMDEAAIEQAGTQPLAPLLAAIDRVDDPTSLMTAIGTLHRAGVPVLFDVGIDADYKQPNVNLAFLGQAGLGLPDREFYRSTDARMLQLREGYVAHVATMLELGGVAEPAARAADIVTFETALAEISVPREALREPEARYARVERAALEREAPLPWAAYFAAVGRDDLVAVSLAPPTYFAALPGLVGRTSMPTLQAYLRWHVLHSFADHLPSSFVDASFAFYGKSVRGQQQLEPRWKRCVDTTDHAMGELVGRDFVAERFSPRSREVALEMIREIEDAFEAGLPKLAWMDAATRKAAVGKMEAIVNKIGYPSKWRSYDALAVTPAHAGNVVAAASFEFDRRLREADRPVDRERWEMTPSTVNAYYNATGNEMVFPAGILQPPFFHHEWPAAMNFGGIGMVMGHELTHGFDDQGRKFDGAGTLRQWWAPEAGERFEERAACVEQLYSGYEVQPGVHLSGKLTLGENIADFGGIKDAHRAYLQWASEHGVDPHSEAMDGLTHEQLFFVSFGQIWCSKSTPETDQVMALTDPHSHPRYRVNGPLANLPEFSQAFACEPGEPMRPQNTCEVW
ncbi:MAG: M13 family metallopeptidase [Deltaproteobacteria bacterium]|nr:M13 family metallopeptidase [Deltaproteobacteria bacterium]